MERQGIITFKGNPLTLSGSEIKIGDTAPDFTVVGGDLKPVRLSDFKGKTVVISFLPSLDTPVCEIQTKRFNAEASKTDAKILTISMDLPFAQKRFCQAHKVTGLEMLSDYKDREFGQKYGVYIKELGLLTRGVIVIDKGGKVTYQEIVKEVTAEPNYDAALANLKTTAATH